MNDDRHSETVLDMLTLESSRTRRRPAITRRAAVALLPAVVAFSGCAADRPDAGAHLPGNLTTFEQIKDAVDSSSTPIRITAVTAITADGLGVAASSVDDTVITLYPDGSSSTTTGPNELRVIDGVRYMYLTAGVGLGERVDETGWYILPDGVDGNVLRMSEILFSAFEEPVNIERDIDRYRIASPHGLNDTVVVVIADTSRQLTAATIETGAAAWTLDISYLPRGATLETPVDPEPFDPTELTAAPDGS